MVVGSQVPSGEWVKIDYIISEDTQVVANTVLQEDSFQCRIR